MEPVTTAALIGGGAALTSSLASSAFSMFNADKSNDFNREMASTRHQREVKDLRAAGLNPVLSAGGSGANVAPSVTPSSPDFGPVASRAMEAMQLRNQTGLANAQIRDLNSGTALKEIDGRIKLATEQDVILQQEMTIRKMLGEIDLNADQRKQLESQLKTLETQRALTRAQTDFSAKQAAALDFDTSEKKLKSRLFDGANNFMDKTERAIPKAVEKVDKFHKSLYQERRQFKSSKEGLDWLKNKKGGK